MDSFLASLKNESREYKKTAVAIDELQREFGVRFEELEDQAILKVKNIKRPMTVMQKSRFAREVKVRPRSAKSELAKAKSNLNQKRPPNTARNFSRGNNFDIDYRRKPKKSSQNTKIWVTDDFPVTTRNNDPSAAFNRVNYPNIYFSNTDNDDDGYNSNQNSSRRLISNDPFQISSHHFDNDQFEGPKTTRRPKTSQKWTSPVCVRKIERKLTDDERLWDDPPVENMAY